MSTHMSRAYLIEAPTKFRGQFELRHYGRRRDPRTANERPAMPHAERHFCVVRSQDVRDRGRSQDNLDREPEFVECGHQPEHRRDLDPKFLVATADVPDVRVTADYGARRGVGQQVAHRQLGRQPAVFGLATIVLVLIVFILAGVVEGPPGLPAPHPTGPRLGHQPGPRTKPGQSH